MRIDATFKAVVKGARLRYVKDTDSLFCITTFELTLGGDECKRVLGSDLYKLAFGCLAYEDHGDGEKTPIWDYKSIKPAVVIEEHTLKVAGTGPYICQPTMRAISPVLDRAEVTLQLEAYLLMDKKTRLGELGAKLGNTVELVISPVQGELPLAGDASKPSGVKVIPGAFGNPQPIAS